MISSYNNIIRFILDTPTHHISNASEYMYLFKNICEFPLINILKIITIIHE